MRGAVVGVCSRLRARPDRAAGAGGGGAVHLRRMQQLSARGSAAGVVVEATANPGCLRGGVERARDLLGPAWLEGSVRLAEVHGTPEHVCVPFQPRWSVYSAGRH